MCKFPRFENGKLLTTQRVEGMRDFRPFRKMAVIKCS